MSVSNSQLLLLVNNLQNTVNSISTGFYNLQQSVSKINDVDSLQNNKLIQNLSTDGNQEQEISNLVLIDNDLINRITILENNTNTNNNNTSSTATFNNSFSNDINCNNHKLYNLLYPILPQDASNKIYVDNQITTLNNQITNGNNNINSLQIQVNNLPLKSYLDSQDTNLQNQINILPLKSYVDTQDLNLQNQIIFNGKIFI